MISARMSRALKVLLLSLSAAAVVLVTAACGSQKIALSKSDPDYRGATLFNQRCSGCHTLSYAATHGSAANVHTAQYNNGPNFDVRCERPMTRVLYAIENGGFSGGIMPQNIVVGQEALAVAHFVSKYAGHASPRVPGVVQCQRLPIGAIPVATAAATSTATATAKKAAATNAKSAGKVRSAKAKAKAKGAGKSTKP